VDWISAASELRQTGPDGAREGAIIGPKG
jgi:hypothetical protein